MMKLEDVKPAISKRTVVTYNGMEFTVSAVIMRMHFKETKWYYQLELHDLKAKSVVIADMEKVKEIEENE